MDFLKKFASEATGTNTTPTPTPATTEKKDSGEETASSQADLYASAQVVADAARSTFQKEPNTKVDNAKVAGAAADLLDAAERYGKLDTSTGIGSYVEKAENYLHQYESSHSTTPAKTPQEPEKKTTAPPPADAKPEGGEPGSESKTGESGDSGSVGGMMKMAGDFLKKN